MAFRGKFVSRSSLKKPRKSRALAGGFVIAVAFLAVFKLCCSPVLPSSYFKTKQVKPICQRSYSEEICDATGDIRIHGNSSTVFVISAEGERLEIKNIMPYAGRHLNILTHHVKAITIKKSPITSPDIPQCSRNFSVPAIVFSPARDFNNHFHDFCDVVIPLFMTSMEFNGEVQLILSDSRPSWAIKFREVLKKLSKFGLIDMDTTSDQALCFQRVVLGLKAYRPSWSNSKPRYSLKDFVKFLKSIYSLKRSTIKLKVSSGLPDHDNMEDETEDLEFEQSQTTSIRPRLLIISRQETRKFMEVDEVAQAAEEIGFQVVVNETGGNLTEVAQFINSFDALMGVHGAGLTNMFFLPEKAVVIQIIPWGFDINLDRAMFKYLADNINLRYLDYMISPNESSLSQHYPLDHEVFTDIQSVYRKGTDHFWPIYFEKQSIKLDVDRFYATLFKAYKLLHK